MTVIYGGWAKPWFGFRRNDTYFGRKFVLTLGPLIVFGKPLTRMELDAAMDAEERLSQ